MRLNALSTLSLTTSLLSLPTSASSQNANTPFARRNASMPAAIPALTSQCHASSRVVCIQHYAAVMPTPFTRQLQLGPFTTSLGFNNAIMPNEANWGAVSAATFVVFDEARGLPMLGADPVLESVARVSFNIHEAPVFVPALNKIFFSQLGPAGYVPQLVLDLNEERPVVREFLSDPPVYAPNGGTFHDGKVYWAAAGGGKGIKNGNSTFPEFRAGIITLDPATNKTETLLNNYFGLYFNGPDDIIIDKKGDIWFTDPYYAWFNALTDTAPVLPPATYRFRPSTGAVNVVEASLEEPNGIALSPDERYMYISDSGAAMGTIDPNYPGARGIKNNSTKQHVIYKYDIVDDGHALANKRAIYLTPEGVPDGLKVSRDGYILTAAGSGVDVVDEYGTLVMRIQTGFPVQ